MKAVNCQSGDSWPKEQVTAASKEKVLDALGGAASKLRSELGESLATVQKFDVPLEQATTSSLEALKQYTLARKASEEKGHIAAVPFDQRAIELDPNFAMGYRSVGDDYASLEQLGRASEYYSKAFQLREHTSEREKLSITCDYYMNVTGELKKQPRRFSRRSRAIHATNERTAIWRPYTTNGVSMSKRWRPNANPCAYLLMKYLRTRIWPIPPSPYSALTKRGRSFTTRPRKN